MVQTVGDGAAAEIRSGVWELPGTITEPMILECRRWLEALNKAEGIAQEGRIRTWLWKLLGGLSGNHTEETVRMKLASFTFALAEHPAYCFDDHVLRRAQRRFKSFWPSAGELIEFMDEYQAEIRVRAQRAFKMIDAGPRKPGERRAGKPWAQGGMEDHAAFLREKADRERKELIEIMRQRDAEAGRTVEPGEWDRLSGEETHAFIDRIGDKRRKMQDAITKRMKGGIRVIPPKSPAAENPTPPPKAAPAPTREQVDRAWAEFRKSHQHGPPPPEVSQNAQFVNPDEPEAGKAGKADKADYQPPEPEERLGSMAADYTHEEEP